MDKLCNRLPKNFEEECVDLVQDYYDDLIQKLLNGKTAEEICEELKFCEKPKTSQRPTTMITESSIDDKTIAVSENKLKGEEMCALCEYLLHFLQEEITDPMNERKVDKILGEVCRKLPEMIQNNCEDFIDTYGSALVAIFAQEFDPSKVCPKIRACPSAQLIEINEKTISQEMKNNKEDKSNCPLCLFGMNELFAIIKNNKTKVSHFFFGLIILI